MSINLALHHILFSKGACTNITKVLIISFVVLTTSNVMMRENAYASSSSSDLARLNSDYKLQTLQQKVLLQNVSPFTSTLPPADFAFFYSFGITLLAPSMMYISKTMKKVFNQQISHLQFQQHRCKVFGPLL
jgi:hypothetical protein